MARIYKTKLKEAEQIVDENATQAPAVQATPAELEQAQAPVDAQVTDDLAATDAILPEGTESVESTEAVDPEVQVNPETVSVEMQIPTDQLAAAVAQATGDVQPAEIAPDALEAQEVAEPLVAQEDTDVIGVEGENAGAAEGLDNTQAAPITESTDVHSNPGYKVAKETEDKLNDLIDTGVKNMADDLTRELKTGDSKIKEAEEVCPACGKTPCECENLEESKITESEDEVKDDLEGKESEEVNKSLDDDVDAIKDSGVDAPISDDLGDEKLDFSKLDGGEDDNSPDLPGGFEDNEGLGNGGMDTSIFDDLDDEEEGLTDIMGRLDGILGDKEEAAQVADSLRTSADVIDAISGNDSPAVVEEDNKDKDEDAYLLSSLLDDDEEPLDFDRISDFGYDDESDDEDDEEDFKDIFGDDDELDKDYDDSEDEEDDFEESNSRIPVKFPEKKVMRERTAPEPKPETKVIKESFGDGIIYPAGSGPEVPVEPLVSRRENLVEAHERAIEARRRAINKFRESIKREKEEKAEFNNRFREALRSSVRISREGSSNSNSWSNNQFIDRYQESQKLDFSKLFEDGFLG